MSCTEFRDRVCGMGFLGLILSIAIVAALSMFAVRSLPHGASEQSRVAPEVPAIACPSLAAKVLREIDQQRACASDADCILANDSCAPLITCGRAFAKSAVPIMEEQVRAYADHCAGGSCLPCNNAYTVAQCQEGVCVAEVAIE